MVTDPETVGVVQSSDPLLDKQKRDVQSMRMALLNCNTSDANSVKVAMNNITVLRIYHQISRIIRYTEEMDKIEEKLYAAIDASLTTMQDVDPRTWMALLSIQERLQKLMIDSHKLLEPYLDVDNLNYVEVYPESSDGSFAKSLLDQGSREKLRTSAQTILAALESNTTISSELSTESGEEDDGS